jgi:translation initiation factor IF-3
VPVPRRFDRRPPERDLTRINERIRVPEVRLIDEDGQQLGVLKIDDALRYAQERDLDLVEVAPEAKPPVCRVLDYSKYKYEQAQKQKQARKHQQQITIREIKFRPKIAQHDYDTKKGHVERFLRHKDKVKVTIMFRGREVTHPERGVQILDRLAEELAEFAIVEQRPLHDGRNMTMMLGPSKAVLAGQYDRPGSNGATAEALDGEAPSTNGAVAPNAAADGNGAVQGEPVAATVVGDAPPAEPAESTASANGAAAEPAVAAEPEPPATEESAAASEPAPVAVALAEPPAAAPAPRKPATAKSAAAKPAAAAKPKAAAATAKPKAAAAKPKAAAPKATATKKPAAKPAAPKAEKKS